ncbi:chromate efflux transporter [Lysinibacillus agricola]|uniref:Chromate efflux transporter n=1 Tax=Lysinibacillus agricola TaxID=2590012 RepID=A0ABX7APE3_9BACI|nr:MULTISPECIES: chromate efflux transporter [Lysinibacillus]KOS62000.1 ChrA protein [Lysinibacillus sp. FJAT-14222]QQP11392.1 chromate efflux transporter [Lysinibacillus agricola]
MRRLWEIFLVSFKLGCTSFGGPTAHLGYFQNEYVQKRKWLSDNDYSQLVALSQFLPGPASSQVGMGVGLLRGGLFGSIVSFLGFTLPSVLLLMAFAYFSTQTEMEMGWIHGLKLVAVAIVAQAIFDMSKKLIPSIRHFIIALLALAVVLLWIHPLAQVTAIIVASFIGYQFFKKTIEKDDSKETVVPISKTTGVCFLVLFAILLIGLPVTSPLIQNEWFTMIEKFYLSGALVFGGGHVVLPLLETQFVQSGLMSSSDFLAGYGMTQAVPGPLFTFASYIGMVIAGVPGAIIATVAIFLPAFLLIVGAMPFWLALNRFAGLRGAMAGTNAAVVGILAAAFIHPIVTQTIQNGLDIVIAAVFLWCLMRWKIQPYLLVLAGICVGIVCY